MLLDDEPTPECVHVWTSAGSREGFTGKTRWQHSENGRGEEQPQDKVLRDAVTRENRPEAWGQIEQGGFCSNCGAWRGALGLEPTHELFVEHTVQVFREVKRVLRHDGTLFLNIGDSYFSGGQRHASDGVRRAVAYDTPGTAPANSQGRDCFCQSLCGVCREAYRIGKSHSARQPAAMRPVSTSGSIHERTQSLSDHLPTSGLTRQDGRSEAATLDPPPTPSLGPARPPYVPASTTPQSASPSRGSRSLASSRGGGCQLCGRSLPDCAQGSAHMVACTCDRGGGGLDDRRIGTDASGSPYQSYTTAALKPKDLVGIPWMLAFALRADGWYLRSAITLCKRNPMPESISDRPTSATEMMFLLSKSPRYFYDQQAIAEPTNDALHEVQSPHEAMLSLWGDVAADGIPSETERLEPRGDVQAMRERAAQGVARDRGGPRIVPGCDKEIQRERGGPRQARKVQPVGSTPPISGSILAVGEGQGIVAAAPQEGSGPPVLRGREGKGGDQEIPDDREGQGILSPGGSQEARSSGRAEHADGGRVGRDKGGARAGVPVLREDRSPTDSGPRDSAVEGRAPRQGEHRPGVPPMQQPSRGTRNRRNWWLITSEPSGEAHFATFGQARIEPCVRAGTSQAGVCAVCRAPWKRIEGERVPADGRGSGNKERKIAGAAGPAGEKWHGDRLNSHMGSSIPWQPTAVVAEFWHPTCEHCPGEAVHEAIVLDPFAGSGTTGVVALKLGRKFLGIELSEKYAAMAERRIVGDNPMFNSDGAVIELPDVEGHEASRSSLLANPTRSESSDSDT